MKPLVVGSKVMFKLSPKDTEWKYAVVHRKWDERSYIIKDKNGNCYRRNRVMLKETSNQDRGVEVYVDEEEEKENNSDDVISLQSGGLINEEETASDSEYMSAEEEVTVTRRGRAVRRPTYLSDYVVG